MNDKYTNVTEAWALQSKETGKVEKLFLFDSRNEAREWATDRHAMVRFKPVKVEIRVL